MTEVLSWDSDFFGFNIADFDPCGWRKNPGKIEQFVKKNRIKLLQCCIDIKNTADINWVESHGFRFVDLKLTYKMQVRHSRRKSFKGMKASESDSSQLEKIARTCFKNSRYYHPPFCKANGDRLVETWVNKSIRGTFDDICLKIEQKYQAVGFITAKYKTGMARIGLVGLKNGYRSKGLGKELLLSLSDFLADKGVKKLSVVTQGSNTGAQNFYFKNGFKLKNVSLWFYRIF
jgi:dTDP-4-amino-4,6-dideoxy-D-galactose acyltransferase